MKEIVKEIERLKKEKNAAILAHYYVEDEIQEIADYVGDSFYLSQKAVSLNQDILVFCGVTFMGESAKIINPSKKVIMPEYQAKCPMAEMTDLEFVKQMKEEYEDLAVVSYINSNAETKKYADVCVTSSNALNIVKSLPNKNILFIPDKNLGRYVAKEIPEKNFLFNEGWCPVHNEISPLHIKEARKKHPDAPILMHPECPPETVALADYVGSTSGIIKYANQNEAKEFIIATEIGVMYQLKKENPDKKFYPVMDHQICDDMKKINLQKVYECLKQDDDEIVVEEQLAKQAKVSLQRMLDLGK